MDVLLKVETGYKVLDSAIRLSILHVQKLPRCGFPGCYDRYSELERDAKG
jgi:hypothetical protein